MTKTFKKIAASVMAVATLAVGVVGMNVSAAGNTCGDISVSSTPTITPYSTTKSYSFSGVTSSGKALSPSITLSTSRTINISYGSSSGYPAKVTICNASNDSEVDHFNIPTSLGTTVTTSRSLPSGTYYFFVTPVGGSRTSGSFTVTY